MFIVTLSGSGSNRYHYVLIISSYPLIAFGIKRLRPNNNKKVNSIEN